MLIYLGNFSINAVLADCIEAVLFEATAWLAFWISWANWAFACWILLSLSVNFADNWLALVIEAFNCSLINLLELSAWLLEAFASCNACFNASFAAIMSDLFEDSTTEFLASLQLLILKLKLNNLNCFYLLL
nr:hypothetical protein [Metamycoplasma hominis]